MRRIAGMLHYYLCTFMIISRRILLRVRFFRQKYKKSKHVFYVQYIFFFENQAVYEIMWKNTVQPDRPEITIRRMRLACWIIKSIGPHSEYVTLITFPRLNDYTNAPRCHLIRTLPVLAVA
jgi:hypothetical protein